jgi:hypothetical protein
MTVAILMIFIHVVVALNLGWLYFGRYAIQRPPLGVFNLWDVAWMLGGIILIPYLYLFLPVGGVAGLLGLGALGILYFTLEPVLRSRWVIWPVIGIVLGADIGSALWFGEQSAVFFAVNNIVQLLAAVGIANTWAQSGMKARDAAILGGLLVLYDVLFTSVLPLMTDLFERFGSLPFAPMVAWPTDATVTGQWLAIGLGDLLLATVFPLAMRKAYGRQAGLTALVLAGAALASVLALPLKSAFPVMVVLGPLMGLQYLYWRRRWGPERTTWQYRQVEPRPAVL